MQATKIQAGLQGRAVRKVNAEEAAAEALSQRRLASAKTLQGAVEATGVRATVAFEKAELYDENAKVPIASRAAALTPASS